MTTSVQITNQQAAEEKGSMVWGTSGQFLSYNTFTTYTDKGDNCVALFQIVCTTITRKTTEQPHFKYAPHTDKGGSWMAPFLAGGGSNWRSPFLIYTT